MKLEDLNLSPVQHKEKEIFINGVSVSVKQYLPMANKTAFMEWVLNHSTDMNTGLVSPVKLKVNSSLALVKWYTDIDLDEKQMEDNPLELYELLNANAVFSLVLHAIDGSDYRELADLIDEVIESANRYNFSAYGIMNTLTSSSADLATQATELLKNVKNAEGLELLSEIKNIIGQN